MPSRNSTANAMVYIWSLKNNPEDSSSTHASSNQSPIMTSTPSTHADPKAAVVSYDITSPCLACKAKKQPCSVVPHCVFCLSRDYPRVWQEDVDLRLTKSKVSHHIAKMSMYVSMRQSGH